MATISSYSRKKKNYDKAVLHLAQCKLKQAAKGKKDTFCDGKKKKVDREYNQYLKAARDLQAKGKLPAIDAVRLGLISQAQAVTMTRPTAPSFPQYDLPSDEDYYVEDSGGSGLTTAILALTGVGLAAAVVIFKPWRLITG